MPDETLALCQKAFDASIELDDLILSAALHFGMGFCHLWRCELDQAEEHLQTSLLLRSRTGDQEGSVLALAYLSAVYRRRREVEKVREYAARAERAATATGMQYYTGVARANLAWLAFAEGDMNRAKEQAESTLPLWEGGTKYPFQWLALWPLLAIALAEGHEDRAIEQARALVALEMQPPPEPLENQLRLAIDAWDRGDAAQARVALDQAVGLARQHCYM